MANPVNQFDRVKAGLFALIKSLVGNYLLGARMDYLGKFPSRVVSQNGDGTLELQPLDSRLPPYSHVPIRYGIPGISAQVAAGAIVDLTFEVADPQRPIATCWQSAIVTSITLTASAIKLGSSGAAQAFVLGTQYATHMGTLQTQLGVAAAAATPLLLPPAAAALKAALTAAQVAAGQLAGDVSTSIQGQ